MAQLIFRDDHGQLNTVEDNLNAQLETAIQRLNNTTRTIVQLILPVGTLEVCGGHDDLVCVDFASPMIWGQDQHTGFLVNPDYAENAGEITMLVGNQSGNYPLRFVVRKSKAIEVTTYFFEHGLLPKREQWSSDIPDELLANQ